jgi:pyruvate,water dikinase
MFTADPISGDRETIMVEASSGLGEAVVSGTVMPDHYLLDDQGRIREFQSGDPDRTQRLPDQVLTDLAQLGIAVAEHFGRPQDIEWAYADDQIWLLQARPMTALPPPPVTLNAAQRRMGTILLDYVPVRPYPIDMSTWLPYGPAGMMAKVTARFGIRDPFDEFLVEDEYGVVDRLVPRSPQPTPAVLLAPWRIVRLAHRYDPGRWTEDPRFAEFLARVQKLAAQDLKIMPWSGLKTIPRQALAADDPIGELRIDYLPRAGLALLRLFIALRLLRRSALLADLIIAHTRTTDANRALEGLAARARENPRLREAVDTLDPTALAAYPEFEAEFAAYLAEFGHRETVTPILATPPTQGEAPETVLALIKVLIAEPPGPPKEHDHALSDHALSELLKHPLLRGPRQRARIQRWVEAARAGVALREDSHFYFLMPLPILRKSLLEMGRRLCDAGVLDEPEQVFHLRLEELEAIEDPAALADPEKLRATMLRRAARREELAGVRLIDPAAVFPQCYDGDALIAGTPASNGTATGPVKIIRGPEEFDRLAAGDILVCPYTNPAWTTLFQRVAAVVVDSGGQGSHAAIVAREYGIPAVMGTGVGTSVLADGQLVTVDGSTGRVLAATTELVRQ